jgi:hypothetical protein
MLEAFTSWVILISSIMFTFGTVGMTVSDLTYATASADEQQSSFVCAHRDVEELGMH